MVGILIRKALKDFEIRGYHISKVGYLVAPCYLVAFCFETLTPWRPCSRTARGRKCRGQACLSGDNGQSSNAVVSVPVRHWLGKGSHG